MLAPNHVSAPAATQTSSMPANVGTARLTSDGCTKIDAPTIVPTTMAVACVRPMDRSSAGAMGRRIVSPTFGDRSNSGDRVGVRGGLVRAIALHASEAQRQAAGIMRAHLQIVERDLDDDLWPDVDRVRVAADLEL